MADAPQPQPRLSLAQRVNGLIRRDAENRAQATRLIVGFMVLGGAFIVGAAQFLPEAQAGQIAWKPAIGIFGAAMAMLGGFWSLLAESSTPAALEAAREALDREADADRQVRDLDEAIEGLEGRLDRMSRLYVTTRSFMEAAERAIMLRQTVEDAVQQVLDNIGAPLTELIGFDAGENWGVSVYEARRHPEDGKLHLHCVATLRADRVSEKKEHRVWPEGMGTVGHAQSSQLEIVVPDMSNTDQTYWIPMAKELSREKDDHRYRSIAAVPVRVNNLGAPWGVVVGSSNHTGRFGRDGDGHQSVEPLRALAAMVALLASHAHVSPKGER